MKHQHLDAMQRSKLAWPFFKKNLCWNCVFGYVCVCTHMNAVVKKDIGCLRAGATGGYETPDIGSGNQI